MSQSRKLRILGKIFPDNQLKDLKNDELTDKLIKALQARKTALTNAPKEEKNKIAEEIAVLKEALFSPELSFGVDRIDSIAQAIDDARSFKFGTIFSLNAVPPWFDWFMKHLGHLTFVIVLVGFFYTTAHAIYRFVKAPNKSINEVATLVLQLTKNSKIMAAIVISLIPVATVALALVSPVLFVAAMALDTLINIGLFCANAYKRLSLYLDLKNQLVKPVPGQKDYDIRLQTYLLTKLKYDSLTEKYNGKMKEFGIASIVGTVLTFATAVIFLFPKVGLGALAATPIVVGAAKLTMAGLSGIAAGLAIALPMVAPYVAKLTNKLAPHLKKTWNFIKTSLSKEQEPKQEPKVEPEVKLEVSDKIFHALMAHKLSNDQGHSVSADYQYTQMRSIIIEHATSKEVAERALTHWVHEKIGFLKDDIANAGSGFFAQKLRPQRNQKLHALLLMQAYLTQAKDKDYAPEQLRANLVRNAGGYLGEYIGNTLLFFDAIQLVRHIEHDLPGVKQSFYATESDTQDIVEAFKAYAIKFCLDKDSVKAESSEAKVELAEPDVEEIPNGEIKPLAKPRPYQV